jgi:transposase
LPERPAVDPTHPLGCHRGRVPDRIVFDKMLQVLRFGCSYQAIADTTCSATTIRNRRDEWIELGVFAQLKTIVLDAYDRIVGLVLEEIAVDGCITKAPGGGQVAGRSPVDRGKQGMKRSSMVDGRGIPLDRILAGANRHDSPLLAPTLDKLDELGPLPETITVHLDAGYDSGVTRETLAERHLVGDIAHKGDKAPIQAGQGGMSSAPTPGTTRSTGYSAATNAPPGSSTPSSTSPTRSSPCVASSGRRGPATDGTPAPPNAHERHLFARPLSSKRCTRTRARPVTRMTWRPFFSLKFWIFIGVETSPPFEGGVREGCRDKVQKDDRYALC